MIIGIAVLFGLITAENESDGNFSQRRKDAEK
jgi:hypothetical protein